MNLPEHIFICVAVHVFPEVFIFLITAAEYLWTSPFQNHIKSSTHLKLKLLTSHCQKQTVASVPVDSMKRFEPLANGANWEHKTVTDQPSERQIILNLKHDSTGRVTYEPFLTRRRDHSVDYGNRKYVSIHPASCAYCSQDLGMGSCHSNKMKE